MSDAEQKDPQPNEQPERPTAPVEPPESTSPSAQPARPGPNGRIAGYVVAVLVNAIILYILNNLPTWVGGGITDDWWLAMPAMTLSIAAQVVANVIFVVYDPNWFKRLAQVVLNLLSLNATWALYRIFPFDLAAPFNQVLRIVLLVSLVGVGIALVVEVVRLVIAIIRPTQEVER